MRNGMTKVKRLLCVICILVLSMGIFATPAYAKVGETYASRVSGLRLHAKPDGQSEVVGRLHKGEKVVHKATSKTWWKVMAKDGTEGYVFRDYLKPLVQTIKKNAYYTVYKTSKLTVRNGPRASSDKLGTIKRGTVVRLGSKQGGWGLVKLSNGKKGWVQVKYLKYLRD